ncbi:TATA box-binding protein-like 1 [Glandiceps talaboti]
MAETAVASIQEVLETERQATAPTSATDIVPPTDHANDNAEQNNQGQGGTEDSGSVDIFINNVVSTFSTRCHLNLRRIGLEGINVEYRRDAGKVMMRLRDPYCTATMWSSGKITCAGCTSEDDARRAARKYARTLQNLGFRVRFSNFKVVNVLGTCSVPFGIRIGLFSKQHYQHSSYEPELHPAVTYKIKAIRATLKIFSTGSITITAPCVDNIQLAVQHIYPLVYEHKMPKPRKDNVSYEGQSDNSDS